MKVVEETFVVDISWLHTDDDQLWSAGLKGELEASDEVGKTDLRRAESKKIHNRIAIEVVEERDVEMLRYVNRAEENLLPGDTFNEVKKVLFLLEREIFLTHDEPPCLDTGSS
jgi:hypothetical protein